MPKTIKHNKITGKRAETLAIDAIRTAGFKVDDLNELKKNFSLADLIAYRGNRRLLVQVRGTTTRRWFRIASEEAEALGALAEKLGLHAIYAFVHVDDAWPEIRFGSAEDVATAALFTVFTAPTRASVWTTTISIQT